MNSSLRRLSHHRALILLVVLALSLYIILPQVGDLHSSWHIIAGLNQQWLAAAVGLTLFTYLAAALTYYFLTFNSMPYFHLVLVQLLAMLVNKLLPAGIGALGANYAYLKKHGLSKVQAGSTVAVNNLLGVIGHFLVVTAALLLFSSKVKLTQFGYSPARLSLAVGVVSLVIVSCLITAWTSPQVRGSLVRLKAQAKLFAARPFYLLAALLSSMSLTLCNVFALICCGLAIGVNLNFAVALLIFSVGAAAAGAVPTPGGVGGFEAGLFAGLVTYHITAPRALAAALLYRLVSYWLPLSLGGLAFVFTQAKQLLTA